VYSIRRLLSTSRGYSGVRGPRAQKHSAYSILFSRIVYLQCRLSYKNGVILNKLCNICSFIAGTNMCIEAMGLTRTKINSCDNFRWEFQYQTVSPFVQQLRWWYRRMDTQTEYLRYSFIFRILCKVNEKLHLYINGGLGTKKKDLTCSKECGTMIFWNVWK
jgi:hypothetical protein